MVVICISKHLMAVVLSITTYYQVIKSLVRRPIQYEGKIMHFCLLVDQDIVNINQEPAI